MTNWQQEFHENHLNEAALRYELKKDDLVKVGGFDNLVYKFKRKDDHYVLRVSHSSRRTTDQIVAELNWIEFLADHGVRVCKPLPSAQGQRVEKIATDRGTFLFTSFEKAPGESVHGNHPAWGPGLFAEWGYLTGCMHACAQSYDPPAHAPRRVTDDQLPIERQDISTVSTEEQNLYRKFRDCQGQILALPKRKESFGLCHRDLHHGNFFVHEGKMTAFDFDDCGYDYFVHDIAMATFYASNFPTWRTPVIDWKHITEFSDYFLNHFMTGYNRAHSMDPFWIKQIPLFMEKRRCDLCLILYKEWGPGHANRQQREWLQRNIECIESGPIESCKLFD